MLNYNDPVLREFGKTPRCKVIFFSSSEELESGVFLRGDTMIIKENGVETPVCTTKDTSLVGMHNYENIMAAIAMTHAMGVPLATVGAGNASILFAFYLYLLPLYNLWRPYKVTPV